MTSSPTPSQRNQRSDRTGIPASFSESETSNFVPAVGSHVPSQPKDAYKHIYTWTTWPARSDTIPPLPKGQGLTFLACTDHCAAENHIQLHLELQRFLQKPKRLMAVGTKYIDQFEWKIGNGIYNL